MANALSEMFKESVPRHVQTDRGKEFYNAKVQDLFKANNINHYTVNSQFKAALVERFNRTLRTKLKRYFTHKGHKIWHDVLPQIIKTYNNTKHRGISNKTPKEVYNDMNRDFRLRSTS